MVGRSEQEYLRSHWTTERKLVERSRNLLPLWSYHLCGSAIKHLVRGLALLLVNKANQ